MTDNHLEHLRTITLSAAERDAMRARLRAFAIAHPPTRALAGTAWRWTLQHGALSLGLAVLLIIGGTGVSAERAHPGDLLYGFRVTVNDRIDTALAFNDDVQIDVEMEQLQRLIDDEDILRDREFGALALADDGDDELADEIESIERQLSGADDQGVDDDSSAADALFDDAAFEEELRSIERELEAEEQMRFELE